MNLRVRGLLEDDLPGVAPKVPADGALVRVRAAGIVRKPTSISYEEATALGIPVATAYQSLRSLGVGGGDVLLIHGTSGRRRSGGHSAGEGLWSHGDRHAIGHQPRSPGCELGTIPVSYARLSDPGTAAQLTRCTHRHPSSKTLSVKSEMANAMRDGDKASAPVAGSPGKQSVSHTRISSIRT